MKLWHADPSRAPSAPVDREHRDARAELIFTVAVVLLGLLGLYVSQGA